MKKSLLVIFKILGMVFNTLTADDEYCLVNKEYLTQLIHMELSRKQKPVCIFFSSVLKWKFNFEHFQKKDDPHSLCISEITDSKKRG